MSFLPNAKGAKKLPGDTRSTGERALAICERLARGGVSLRSAAKAEGLAHTTFLAIVKTDAPLREAYETALEAGTHAELDALGRECSRVMIAAKEPFSAPYVSAFGHKLKLAMWRAEKRAPRVYGQKVDLNHAGSVTVTLAASDKGLL